MLVLPAAGFLLLSSLFGGSAATVVPPASSKAALFQRTLSAAGRQQIGGGSEGGGLKLRSLAEWITPEQLRHLSAAGKDYWGTMMPAQLEQLTTTDAAAAFEQFKYLETLKVYKDFLATGNTDAAAKGDAQLSALKELVTSLAQLQGAFKAQADGSFKGVNQLLADGGAPVAADVAALKAGDAAAMHRLQQAYADKYLGGLNLSALYDNTWVDSSRDSLAKDDLLQRVIGDDNGILDLLLKPHLKLVDPTKEGAEQAARRLYDAMLQ